MAERWMTIRVYGTLLHATGAWGGADDGAASAVALTPDHIEGWMASCAANGVTGVLWQSNCGGTSTHPSPVLPLPGPPLPPHNEHWNPVWTYLCKKVRRFDTLEIAIAAAHRHDLRLIYALCPADFVDSPFAASAFHPDLWVQSRRGEPFHGVPCLAEPEAQFLLLEHLVAVLDCGVDDLAISCFSHMAGQGVNQRDYYGFNPAPLQAYREQRAIDPLHHGINADLWHTLHGDFYTAFLGRVHAETSKRGQRLIPFTTRAGNWGWGGEGGAQLVAHYLQGQAVPTAVPAFALELQWQALGPDGTRRRPARPRPGRRCGNCASRGRCPRNSLAPHRPAQYRRPVGSVQRRRPPDRNRGARRIRRPCNVPGRARRLPR